MNQLTKAAKTLAAKYNSTSLILRIAIGLVVGSVLALICPGAAWIEEFGNLFVGALKGVAPVLDVYKRQATIKTYHLSSAVTDLGYETNAAGVVTAVTFTGSSGMTSAMESMTNSDDEVIAQQADSYAQAYVAENSDTFAASAAADRCV